MKEIIQAVEARIKGPVMGYFGIAVLIFNWQELFFLIVDNGDAASRIKYFVDNTSVKSLLYVPLASAVIYTIVYPWVSVVFLYICQKPTDLINALQAKSEHKTLTVRNDLEKLRAESLAIQEQSIIESAKRDQQIEEIEDEALKENVKSNIQAVREKENKKSSLPYQLNDPDKLLATADGYRERARNTNNFLDRDEWLDRAKELERKAHQIISGSIDSP